VAAVSGRFWRSLAVGVAGVVVGSASHAYDAIGHPGPPRQAIGPITVGFYLLAVVTLVWAMFRLPLGMTDRARRSTLWLDTATVMLTGAVFIWQFFTRPALPGQIDTGTSLLTNFVMLVPAMVAIFVVTKITLSGSRTVDVNALRLLALALAVGCIGGAPAFMLAGRTSCRASTRSRSSSSSPCAPPGADRGGYRAGAAGGGGLTGE
jgi:hypothetical protein